MEQFFIVLIMVLMAGASISSAIERDTIKKGWRDGKHDYYGNPLSDNDS